MTEDSNHQGKENKEQNKLDKPKSSVKDDQESSRHQSDKKHKPQRKERTKDKVYLGYIQKLVSIKGCGLSY